ncbi:MAG: insulinase family protein [Myxococcales bacterium]|nr:insulinase family protein [Myxococcales bacterium]
MPEILVVHRPWPPLVAVRVFVGGGAALDPVGKEGQTLLGWLSALRGTKSKDRLQLQGAIDAIAAQVDVAVDKSGAWLTASVAAERLEPLVQLLAEIVSQPRFDPSEVHAQRDELIADLRHMQDDDGALADDALSRYLFRGQAVGRPSQGTELSLATIRSEDLAGWHARQITASNLRIGFAGAIDLKRATELVSAAFGALSSKSGPKIVHERAVVSGRRLLLVDKPKRTQTQIALALSTVGAQNKDLPALLVANAVFGGPFSARLSRDVRQLRGWAYHTEATLTLGAVSSTWIATLGTGTADAVAALELTVKLWEELGRHGVTPAELRFVKDWLLGAHRLTLETAAAELGYQMRGRALGLELNEITQLPAKIAAVDLKTVQRVLKERCQLEHLVGVMVGPSKLLAAKVAESLTQFAIEELPADGAPELTTGSGRAVTSKPLPSAASPTTAQEPEEADPDEVDDGADLDSAP